MKRGRLKSQEIPGARDRQAQVGRYYRRTIEIHNEEYALRKPLEIARVSREALEDLLNE